MGLSALVGVTRERPSGGWVHPGSLGSLAHALGIIRFVRGPSVHSRAPLESLGFPGVVNETPFRAHRSEPNDTG